MNIIIARDDQTFGPYSKDQVAELIAQGELSPDDLGSWEGGEDWVSLNQLLSSSPDSEGENEDDFDHEKMKQWEDVFVDDEEGFEDDDQFVDDQEDDPPAPPVQTSVPPSLEIAEDQGVPSVPPPVAPSFQAPPAPVESVPDEFPPPPPPPPPPVASSSPPRSVRESKAKARDNDHSDRPSPITPRSKKIKGLNRGQTVIVVKSAGIFSKLYTISLVFLILAVLSYLVAFVLVTVWPEDVGPKLQRVGIPLQLFGHEGPSGDSPAPAPAPQPPSSGSSDSNQGTSSTGTK